MDDDAAANSLAQTRASDANGNASPTDAASKRSRSPTGHPLPPRPPRDSSYSDSRRRGSRSRSRSPRGYRRNDRPPRRHISPSERGIPEPSKVLGVFGLSILTKERDLDRLFGAYGPISDISMILDKMTGKSRGFAFITFQSEEDAAKARSAMNGFDFNERKMRVDFSLTKGDDKRGSRPHRSERHDRDRGAPAPPSQYHRDHRESSRYEPYRDDRYYDRGGGSSSSGGGGLARDRYGSSGGGGGGRYDDAPRYGGPPPLRDDYHRPSRYDDYGAPPPLPLPPIPDSRSGGYYDDRGGRGYDDRGRYDDRSRLPPPMAGRSPPPLRRAYGSRSPPPPRRGEYGGRRSLSPPM